MPVVRTDGRSVGHVIAKFSGMGRFPQLWGSAHARASCARGAPLLQCHKLVIQYFIMKKRKKKKEKKTFREVNKMSQELRKWLRGKFHPCCSEWIRMVFTGRADYIFVQLVTFFQGNSAGGREYSNLGHVQVPNFNEAEVLANVQTFVRSVLEQLFIFLETQFK